MSDNKPSKINVMVVVSGIDQPVTVNVHQTVEHLAEEALRESGHEGQPLADWELKDAGGVIIPFATKVEDAGIKEGTKVYLNPKVGTGGCH
jgi:ribosomal silencing factor RsfS